jgi:DNA-binding XRE family transcriptional regulator
VRYTPVVQFPEGTLQRELDRRGLSQRDAAQIATVSKDTIYRANKGENLKKKNYSKIVVMLSVVPVLELPVGMATL